MPIRFHYRVSRSHTKPHEVDNKAFNVEDYQLELKILRTVEVL